MSFRSARSAAVAILVTVAITSCGGGGGAVAESTATASSASTAGGQQTSMFLAINPIGRCVHLESPWSDYECPDSNAQWMQVSAMDSVAIVVKTKAGVIHVSPIPPGTDVIFLSKMSVDSILTRYYDVTKAGTKAAGLRDRMRRP